MSRPRIYASDAERQKAHRARHADKQAPLESTLAALARTLHSALKDAAATGDTEAANLLGQKSDDTLRNLIAKYGK